MHLVEIEHRMITFSLHPEEARRLGIACAIAGARASGSAAFIEEAIDQNTDLAFWYAAMEALFDTATLAAITGPGVGYKGTPTLSRIRTPGCIEMDVAI